MIIRQSRNCVNCSVCPFSWHVNANGHLDNQDTRSRAYIKSTSNESTLNETAATKTKWPL